MKKVIIVLLIGAGGFITFYLFRSPSQKIETSTDESTAAKIPLSLKQPTGDLVVIENDLLKAVRKPSILREARLLPRKKNGTIECFEIVHIDEESKIKELKLMSNDCLISFTSFKHQGEDLLREEVVLNSADAMTKVFPALNGAVRVNLHYYRGGKEAISFYFLKD